MHLFVQLFSKYLMSLCYGPDIVQNVKDTRVSKAEMVSAFLELLSISGNLQ